MDEPILERSVSVDADVVRSFCAPRAELDAELTGADRRVRDLDADIELSRVVHDVERRRHRSTAFVGSAVDREVSVTGRVPLSGAQHSVEDSRAEAAQHWTVGANG